MANRYWINTSSSTANWDDNANWSATSGGAGGASYPVSGDNVFFDLAPAPGGVQINFPAAGVTINDFTHTEATSTYIISGISYTFTVTGNFSSRGSGFLTIETGSTGKLAFTGSGKTISANGGGTNAGDFISNVEINSAGTITLNTNLAIDNARTLTLTAGTLNVNGKTIATGFFASNNSNTRTLNFGTSGIIDVQNVGTVWNATTSTNLTISGTGTIKITGGTTSAKTFNGGSASYPITLSHETSGALTITGSNTFTTIQNTVQPTTFRFVAGTTTTVTNWSVNGTSGNLVTVTSATALAHTLSKASGTVNSSFLNLSYSTATGGATWNALSSTNGGNNTGWNFSVTSGRFFALFFS